MSFPSVGDATAYEAKGLELYTQARSAAQGDAGATAALLQDGVALAQSAGSGLIDRGVMSAIVAGATGFAVGGPIGAAAGLATSIAGSLAASIAAENNAEANWANFLRFFGGQGAAPVIYKRLLDWNAQNVNPDPMVDAVTGKNAFAGWSLYNYAAQVPASAGGQREMGQLCVCTPVIWLQDPNHYGCTQPSGSTLWSFALNGDDPANQQAYLLALQAAVTGNEPVGMTSEEAASFAVSRCPSSSLYDAGHFLPDTALTLATVFGMLQVGASDRSIASELLIQRHLHKTYDGANSLWSADSESICSLFVGRAKATDPPVSQTSLLHSMLLSRVQSASVPRKPWPKRVSVAQLPSASAVPPVAKAVGLAAGVVLAYRLAKLFL